MPKTFLQGKVGWARYDSAEFRRESTPQARLSAIGRLARRRALGRFDFRVGFHLRQLAQECEVVKSVLGRRSLPRVQSVRPTSAGLDTMVPPRTLIDEGTERLKT